MCRMNLKSCTLPELTARAQLAYMLSVLTVAGYKTGRDNSPAVFDCLEVFSINGENISRDDYAKYMTIIKEKCDEIVNEGFEMPTYFEVETAFAYKYFYDNLRLFVFRNIMQQRLFFRHHIPKILH